MFPDIGATEYLIIGIVALLVFKPQDLPVIMKKVGIWVGRARRMAADFRASFDDMARQSELDQLRKEVETMRSQATQTVQAVTNPVAGLSNTLSETVSDIDQAVRGPSPAPPVAAEPAPEPKAKPKAKAASKAKAETPAPAKASKTAPAKAAHRPRAKKIVTK